MTAPTATTDDARQNNATTERRNKFRLTNPPTIKMILTFDDGPTERSINNKDCKENDNTDKASDNTAKVLKVLQKNEIRAIFFIQTDVDNRGGSVCGKANLIHALKQGHSIQIHTGSVIDHTRHTERVKAPPYTVEGYDGANNQNGLDSDLIKAKRYIANLPGGQLPTLVRPPEGVYNSAVSQAYKRQNLAMMLWDVDSKDSWPGYNSEKVVAALKKQLKEKINSDKPVTILFHDIKGTTVKNLALYLKTIRDAVQSKGYSVEFGLPEALEQ